MPDRISRELMYWAGGRRTAAGRRSGTRAIPPTVHSRLRSFGLGRGLLVRKRVNRPGKRSPGSREDDQPAESAAAALGLGGMAATPIEVFGAARSGRLEVAVIEASQVSETGAIADRMAEDGWPTPTNDMALGARKTIALMEHTTLRESHGYAPSAPCPRQGPASWT